MVAIEEYVHTDLGHLRLLRDPGRRTLLALVGVQSHHEHNTMWGGSSDYGEDYGIGC